MPPTPKTETKAAKAETKDAPEKAEFEVPEFENPAAIPANWHRVREYTHLVATQPGGEFTLEGKDGEEDDYVIIDLLNEESYIVSAEDFSEKYVGVSEAKVDNAPAGGYTG